MAGVEGIVSTPVLEEDAVHTLVVRGPACDRLYDLFSRIYAATSDVVVVKDRRLGERRRAGAIVAEDRRRADRRARTPWLFPPE
jgi:hypothetical protein